MTRAEIFRPQGDDDMNGHIVGLRAFDQQRDERLGLFPPGIIFISEQFFELVDQNQQIATCFGRFPSKTPLCKRMADPGVGNSYSWVC